jgi:sugar lactone lactonase YvrE
MTMRPLLRVLALTGISLALAVPTATPAAAHPDALRHQRNFPDRIDLPDGFLPEGITIDARGRAYFGSRRDGSIYRANLRTGEGRIISPGAPGTLSVGLKIDRRGRLFVSGGSGGTGRVIDARSGAVLREYRFTDATPTFVNDVVLTRRAAYFTESRAPQLYVVPLGRRGRLPRAEASRVLPLTGDWQQADGNNANGIAQTPDRRALLVIQSNTGKLFRVNRFTGVARQVDLGGVALTNGDGLLVRGRTLYVVQNRLNQIAVVRLNRSGTRGTVSPERLKSPTFDVPTTVAAYRGSLYLPNARFRDTPLPADAEYWVSRVRLRRS